MVGWSCFHYYSADLEQTVVVVVWYEVEYLVFPCRFDFEVAYHVAMG